MIDSVVLVNEFDEEVGTMEKMEAHRQALLHRAFSVFIFDAGGRMLLQRRALTKYHSGGLWTNACCSKVGRQLALVVTPMLRTRPAGAAWRSSSQPASNSTET